ncbi:MAG TPA: hypothetical protein VII47_03850, partial [Actinomycetota bacterium]
MHDPPALLPEQDLAPVEAERDPEIVVTVQEADIEAAELLEDTPGERPCALLVSGDSPLFCESLARLLGAAPGLTAAHAALDRLAEADVERVTVLLLNVHAYRRQIVGVVAAARKRWPGLRVLLLVKGPAAWC